MIIEQINIKSLYFSYNYNIKFPKNDNICFITGPNGYGKTTILRILDALAKRNLLFFYTLPFSSIEIFFSNKQRLLIKSENKSSEAETVNKDFADYTQNREINFFIYKIDNQISDFVLNHELLVDAIRKVRLDRYYIHDTDEFTFSDMIEFVVNNPDVYDMIADALNQNQFLMVLSTLNISYIPSQRIYQLPVDETSKFVTRKRVFIQRTTSINEVVQKLKNLLEKVNFDYLQASQEKDRNFIKLLLKNNRESYSKNEYEEKSKKLTPLLEQLHSFGLIDSKDIFPYAEKTARILSAYIDNLEEKLTVFTDISKQLNLFKILLERKNFSNKTISFSLRRGIVIQHENGNFLNENNLSSGEQNEIIMLYDFIFETKNNSLLLIDEPENSLHLVWQQQFLQDAKKIAKEKNIQLIIATHSPDIIGDSWEITIDLFELNGKTNEHNTKSTRK